MDLFRPQLDEQEAVVILQKTPITGDTVEEMFAGAKLKLEMRNDIYSTYHLQPPAHLNGAATATHTRPPTHSHPHAATQSGLACNGKVTSSILCSSSLSVEVSLSETPHPDCS